MRYMLRQNAMDANMRTRMVASANTAAHRQKISANRRGSRGFTLIQALIALAIGTTVTIAAVPSVTSTIQAMKLSSAVSSTTGAISSTRYQAIMHGYPYTITFSPSAFTYQLASEIPPATTFTNVGTAVPLSGTVLTLNAATVLQFNANGTVSCTTCGTGMALNAPTLSIAYGGHTATITVSSVGYVTTSTN